MCVLVDVFFAVHLFVCVSGVLQELGSLDQDCVSQREAERYVVKMDQCAHARIDSLIQEAYSNSYTLFILVHDHAHCDINRCVCVKKKITENSEVMQNYGCVCLASSASSLFF